MKTKLYLLMATLGFSILTFVAFMTSVSACLIGHYQPEEPTYLFEK